jgi:hypothetical protein
MSTPDPPHLEPVRNDGIRAVQVGLGLLTVTGLVLVVQRDALEERGTLWWVGVCGAGLLIGLVQWAIFAKRRALIRAREQEGIAREGRDPQGSPDADPEDGGPTGSGSSDARSAGTGPTG